MWLRSVNNYIRQCAPLIGMGFMNLIIHCTNFVNNLVIHQQNLVILWISIIHCKHLVISCSLTVDQFIPIWLDSILSELFNDYIQYIWFNDTCITDIYISWIRISPSVYIYRYPTNKHCFKRYNLQRSDWLTDEQNRGGGGGGEGVSRYCIWIFQMFYIINLYLKLIKSTKSRTILKLKGKSQLIFLDPLLKYINSCWRTYDLI